MFYNTFQQKVNTWCFIILTGTIIWTFFFREWDNSSEYAVKLAKMDHQMPADTEVVKIKHLLLKLSATYDLPVDSIGDKIIMVHDATRSASAKELIKTIEIGKNLSNISNLSLLKMIDKMDDKKLPNVSSVFTLRMELAIFLLSCKNN